MLTALAFILINCASYILALFRHPFWGLFAYLNVYFNPPNPRLNWWADYLFFDRWSLVTSIVLVLSLIIHKKNLAQHNYANTAWIFPFLGLSILVTHFNAVDQENANHFLYLLFTYCFIIFVLLKSIINTAHMRWFFLMLVAFITKLSVDAYLYGKRINGRLEMIGSADANGSNEFSLLIASIIPLIIVFLKDGNRYERLLAIGATPFVLNAFILCNSRGSTIAFLSAIAISVLIIADKRARRGIILMLVLLAPAFVYLTDSEYISRFTTLFGFQSALQSQSEARNLSSGRTEIWEYGLDMAKDHPFGVAPNGFKKLSRFYMPEEVLTFKENETFGVRSAHNTYLQVLVEEGIIGLIIWLLLCLHTCFILWRSFRLASRLQKPDPFWRDSMLALNIAFFTVLIGGLANSRIFYEYFWWQLAMAAVAYSLSKQIATAEKPVSVN